MLQRTSDQRLLAEYLASGIRETADYVEGLANLEDTRKARTVLSAARAQLENAMWRTQEALDAIDEARQFGEAPQWDVEVADRD